MTTGMEPYRPPKTPPRGWRVGPTIIPTNTAAASGDGLPATVTVDQSNTMDVAVATGDGLTGDVSISTVVNSNNAMLLADGSGGSGLSANVTVDQSIIMNLADGSGGTALVPTLTVVSPITFGASTSGGASSGDYGIEKTWSHTKIAADNVAIVSVFYETAAIPSTYTRSTSYGGTAMTSLGASPHILHATVYVWCEWWYLMTPASGAQTVSTTITGGSGRVNWQEPVVLTYKNVGSVLGTLTTANGTAGTAVGVTVSSAVNRKIVSTHCADSYPGDGNRTVRNSSYNYIQEAAGAASVTMSATTVDEWSCAALQLLP